ncbi:hypothetical protein [Streptomyces kaniharaensis]|uniref:hypothetical protein n=1 Tax=Streptomyces kaniharaensis TaxID=212423 RepID=UPI0012952623|nr:hypothetical protein [Streptomyces kaniharaensis]
MSDQDNTRNVINGGTIHGDVVMGGAVSLKQRPRPGLVRTLVVVACALALVGAGTTYYAFHAADGDDGPRLNARYEPGHGDANTTAVVPRVVTPSELPAVTGCGAARTWLHTQGATDVGASPLTISMAGNGHTVAIEGLRATIVGEPRDPLPGTVVDCSEPGEGEKIDLGVDLDATDPVALIGSYGPVSFAPYFTDKYVYLENQKPEVISLTVLAARHSYDYVLTVEGSVDGEHRTWTLKDGDRPFHISGVRRERTTSLLTRGRGWETSYSEGAGSRLRCNPCYDREEQEIPGTAVGGAPGGYSPTFVSATDPAKRPAAPTPPLTVDEHDAESVAIAWAVTAGSTDTSRGDTGPAAVLPRIRRYLTRELAAEGGGLNPCTVDGVSWPAEMTARRGWSVVLTATASPIDGKYGASHLTGDTVELEVPVTCVFRAEDGWSQQSGFFSARVKLQRQSDGSYLISTIRKMEYGVLPLPGPAQ